jgi:hypothetical protein
MMIVSTILIGELSVAVLALPALPNTLSTSGTDLMILSCTCNIRLISELETSGNVTGMKRILCSSSGGINSVPRPRNKGMVMINAIRLIAIVVLRHLRISFIIGSYILSKNLFTGLALSGLNFPFIKKEIKTGASVITSKASTIIMNVLVNARG